MTISIDEYYATKQAVRKKEPQYVAFINKNSCTSCNSCASMCPVDCIYEVPGAPAQSYHVVDTSRCIGCQMCYRVPSESTGPWTMEICPWNAIDLIHNPNVKEWESVLAPYYAEEGSEPDFRKLEELGYQLTSIAWSMPPRARRSSHRSSHSWKRLGHMARGILPF
jgi:ferredoxin